MKARIAPKSTSTRRGAFTLIELLVVIAILAILIGLIVPGLAAARSSAHRSVCLSRQRQIGIAMVMYADMFREWIPRAAKRYPDLSWLQAYRPLLDSQTNWQEPYGDLFETAEYFHDPARLRDGFHNVHYVVNGMRFAGPHDYAGSKAMFHMSKAYRPEKILYLTDYGLDPKNKYYNKAYIPGAHDFDVARIYDVYKEKHVTGSKKSRRIHERRHGDGANALFLDGRATLVKPDVLRDLDTWDDGDYTG